MSIHPKPWLLVLGASLACGCATSTEVSPPRRVDGGSGSAAANAADAGGAPDFGSVDDAPDGSPKPTTAGLVAVIRDFKLYRDGDSTTNPDFENVPRTDQNGNPNSGYLGPWDDRGIVTATLGADGKPVYASPSGVTLTTHGRAAFDEWFRDVPGKNVRVDFPIVLQPMSKGAYGYDSEATGTPLSASNPQKMFFPLDDGTPYATMFGNQGKPHNYAFTVELHTTFTYRGGEYFSFRGDDDIFVYIAGNGVINLGGIHGPEAAEVQVDALGLTQGHDYPLDFFSAERHVEGSNVLFTTTLDLRPVPK